MLTFSLIVLSNTNSKEIFEMNTECFKTFIISANKTSSSYEIILVESNKDAIYDYQISNLNIVTPEANFNFHKFLNIGINHSNGNYYILSNNDVVFDSNWLVELLKVKAANPLLKSFSPYDKTSNKLSKALILNNDYVCGYDIQKHLTGWCIVLHRSVISKIKHLDERFNFYAADKDYAMQLQKHNIKHALVTKAFVLHLEGKSTAIVKPFELPKRTPKYVIEQNWTWVLRDKKMIEGLIMFHDKWGSRKVIKIKLYLVAIFSKFGLGYFNKFIMTNS